MAVCDVLDVYAPLVTPRETIRAMIAAEAKAAGLSLADVLGPSRRRSVVSVRHRAIRLVHAAYPNKSFPEIGRIFARDHATVMYALGRLKRSPRT